MRLMKTFGPAAPVSRSSDAREIPVGRAIVPAGSVIRGVVSAVTKLDASSGKGVLAVAFDRITVSGRSYTVRATVERPWRARASAVRSGRSAPAPAWAPFLERFWAERREPWRGSHRRWRCDRSHRRQGCRTAGRHDAASAAGHGAALGLRNIEIIGRSGPEYARMFERLASLEDPRDCQRQKTSEVYSRYAIVDEATISEAASTVNRGAKVRRISATDGTIGSAIGGLLRPRENSTR